jgi:hypothetical protein
MNEAQYGASGEPGTWVSLMISESANRHRLLNRATCSIGQTGVHSCRHSHGIEGCTSALMHLRRDRSEYTMGTPKALVPSLLSNFGILGIDIVVEATIPDMKLIGRHSDNGSFAKSASTPMTALGLRLWSHPQSLKQTYRKSHAAG